MNGPISVHTTNVGATGTLNVFSDMNTLPVVNVDGVLGLFGNDNTIEDLELNAPGTVSNVGTGLVIFTSTLALGYMAYITRQRWLFAAVYPAKKKTD